MKSSTLLALPIFLLLVLGRSVQAQPYNLYRVTLNNLTGSTIELLICQGTNCNVPFNFSRTYDIGPNSSSTVGANDNFTPNAYRITDLSDNKQLLVNLSSGQFDPAVSATLTVQVSGSRVEVRFSNNQGANTLVGSLA